MQATHGVAPARARLVVREETLDIPVSLPNRSRRAGEPDMVDVDLVGYCKGPGVPVEVLVALDEADAQYDEDRPTDEETGRAAGDTEPAVPATLAPLRWQAKLNRALRQQRKAVLMAVLRDPRTGKPLGAADASLLANDDGPWQDILSALGWWRTAPDSAATGDSEGEGEGDARPEAGAGASGGPPDSPASPQPIPGETRSR